MGVKWDDYPDEKKRIKLKYLDLLKEKYAGKDMPYIRETLTGWALAEFPYLPEPIMQFGGSFDHYELGFFAKDHGVQITKKAVESECHKRNITPITYIDELIRMVEQST